MKEALNKFVFGLVFGLGLSFSMLSVFYIVDNLNGNTRVYKEYDNNAKLVISNKHSIETKNGIIVLGTLENRGSSNWQYIKLEAEIFDSNGLFVDECSETIDVMLKPKESENFKITCGGCNSSKIDATGEITIKIKSASYVSTNNA